MIFWHYYWIQLCLVTLKERFSFSLLNVKLFFYEIHLFDWFDQMVARFYTVLVYPLLSVHGTCSGQPDHQLLCAGWSLFGLSYQSVVCIFCHAVRNCHRREHRPVRPSVTKGIWGLKSFFFFFPSSTWFLYLFMCCSIWKGIWRKYERLKFDLHILHVHILQPCKRVLSRLNVRK
jgi:hypothetical protein